MGRVIQFPGPATVVNITMRKLIASGRAVPVEKLPGARYVRSLDLWLLGEGLEVASNLSLARVLYCEKKRARWVESIGVRHDDLLVLAAFDDRFVEHDSFDCIYEKRGP